MFDNIENGMVSGAWPYNARIDEPLTLDDLAWIYRNERMAVQQYQHQKGKRDEKR